MKQEFIFYDWVKTSKDNKTKTVLNVFFFEIVIESNKNQLNYGLIKEDNFTTVLCKNGYMIKIF